MFVVHIDDTYHYVTRTSLDVTLCGRIAPIHSMAVAPVHGAHLVTCCICLSEAEIDEHDTRPVPVVSDD